MASASIYLDKRRELKAGGYPVKIRVTNKRETKYYPTDYVLTPAEYERIMSGKRLNDAQSEVRSELLQLEKRASDTIKKIPFFTFDVFAARFTSKGDLSDIIHCLKSEFNRLDELGKISARNTARQTFNSLISFTGVAELNFSAITPEFLRKYEHWERHKQKHSDTTIWLRVAIIRQMFNEAIANGYIDRAIYPFGKGRYSAPTPNNNKRALTIEQIGQLIEYKTTLPGRRYSVDMFLFSYFSSGMNMVDIFSLKWSDLEGHKSFTFERQKSMGRAKKRMPITVLIREHHLYVFKKYGSRKIGNDFIFDVLTPDMEPDRMFVARQVAIRKINYNLERIAKELGWSFKLTTYHARHSYSTILMKTAPVAYISKQLGHHNISTTEDYLGQFSKEDSEKYEEALLPKKTGA